MISYKIKFGWWGILAPQKSNIRIIKNKEVLHCFYDFISPEEIKVKNNLGRTLYVIKMNSRSSIFESHSERHQFTLFKYNNCLGTISYSNTSLELTLTSGNSSTKKLEQSSYKNLFIMLGFTYKRFWLFPSVSAIAPNKYEDLAILLLVSNYFANTKSSPGPFIGA